ncbi:MULTISPECIES: hypothetical protein [unclassified Bartonella]|uniref:hypothetical protein n=1 Tax=unclassified Bartonella TaxID=2645622 RepID=UPI0035CF9D74
MIKIDRKYRYLVVGGTGILAPLCRLLGLNNVIIAARFRSHQSKIELFQTRAKCIF